MTGSEPHEPGCRHHARPEQDGAEPLQDERLHAAIRLSGTARFDRGPDPGKPCAAATQTIGVAQALPEASTNSSAPSRSAPHFAWSQRMVAAHPQGSQPLSGQGQSAVIQQRYEGKPRGSQIQRGRMKVHLPTLTQPNFLAMTRNPWTSPPGMPLHIPRARQRATPNRLSSPLPSST